MPKSTSGFGGKSIFRLLLIINIVLIAFSPESRIPIVTYGLLIHFMLFASLLGLFCKSTREKVLEDKVPILDWGKTFKSMSIMGIMAISMYILHNTGHHYLFVITLAHCIIMLGVIKELKKEARRRLENADNQGEC